MPSLIDTHWPVPRFADKFRILFREASRLSMSTLTERLAALYGDRPAFFLDEPLEYAFFSGDCLTHRDLARLTARTAHALQRVGVARGERVGLLTTNRIELAFAEFATLKLGAVAVPMNAMLRARELRHLIQDCGIETLVTDSRVFEQSLRDTDAFPEVKRWIMVGEGAAPSGVHAYGDLLADADDRFASDPLPSEALAMVLYTSGTTGVPKGAMLSDGALMHSVRAQARLSTFLPTPRRNLSLLVMPLAHTSGHQAMLLQLVMGTPMLLHGQFSPQRVLETIQKYRVTMFSGVPAMFKMLRDAGAENYDLSSIEILAWGGDAMPRDLLHRFRELTTRRGRFGRRKTPLWISGYGLAETAGQVTRVMGSVADTGVAGRPLRGVQVRILDDAGKPVPRGEVGELWVKSPGLMLGYLGRPKATAEVLRDGWFRTGDLVREGPGRRLVLQSRAKDMIKVGGYSVFPAEVERQLSEHPDVLQVAVVGLPHEVKGSVPVAAVVRQPGSDLTSAELMTWSREHIAPYKAPREIVFVDKIPVSSTLKMQRHAVREHLLAQRAAGERRPEARV
ncbi:MAG: acyl--CoA ligase, partial [Deltaproteobacteria bacterium]